MRKAQAVANGHPITVACIIKATKAPPGLSSNRSINQGKNIARVDINIRFIINLLLDEISKLYTLQIIFANLIDAA
jgi:hypothetical protein